MKNKDYVFFDKDNIKVIHLTEPESRELEIVEIGYGRSRDTERYVLMRDYYILQFVTGGRGRFCGENFGAGDMILVRPGQLEVREPDTEALYECAWIMMRGHIVPELLRSVYPKDGGSVLKINKTAQAAEKIKSTVDALWSDRSVSVEFSMLGVFYSLLALFPAEKGQNRSDPVSSALTYIKLNYKDQDLRISDISVFSGVTQNHLCKLFKKETGKSIMETLLECRLSESAVLLKNTDITASEIAYSVGFADPKHFSQMFREKYKATPSEYRIKEKMTL